MKNLPKKHQQEWKKNLEWNTKKLVCMFSCVILLVSIMLGANLKTHNTFYPHIGFYVNCSQIIFMHLVFSIEDDTLFWIYKIHESKYEVSYISYQVVPKFVRVILKNKISHNIFKKCLVWHTQCKKFNT